MPSSGTHCIHDLKKQTNQIFRTGIILCHEEEWSPDPQYYMADPGSVRPVRRARCKKPMWVSKKEKSPQQGQKHLAGLQKTRDWELEAPSTTNMFTLQWSVLHYVISRDLNKRETGTIAHNGLHSAQHCIKLALLVHTCDPSTLDAKTGASEIIPSYIRSLRPAWDT